MATVMLLAVVLLGGLAGAWAVRSATYQPTEGSPEVGFSRDMIQHHGQAVTMSFLVRDRTDDPEVRALALDLVTSQAEEQGMLTAWLRRHDVPASSTVPQMAWMTTPVAGGDGPDGHGVEHVTDGDAAPMTTADIGMASDDELTLLARLDGREAEILFLRLMRAHHVGGQQMIEAYLQRGTDQELTRIARGMLTAQTRETRQIDELMRTRGVTA